MTGIYRMKSLLCIVIFSITAGLYGDMPKNENPDKLGLGFGVGVGNSVYKGDDTRIVPFPLVYYNYGNFYLSGKRAGYNIITDGAFELGIIAQWRTDGYDSDDSRYLDGMDDRDMSIDGGVSASYKDGWAKTTLSYVTDLLSKHDGQELVLSYGKRFSSGKFSFTPSVGIAYKTDNLTDYYYGVLAKEATPTRAEYKGDEVIDPFISMQTRYDFENNWSVIGTVSYEMLGSGITDSPIVDDDYQVMVMVGMMYSF